MKVISIKSGSAERQVLCGLITDKVVVSTVSATWTKGGHDFFRSEWSRQVAEWAIEYFQKYNEPIGRQIVEKFNRWAEQAEPAQIKLMERFLSFMSDEFDQVDQKKSSDFVLDLANEHFLKVRARNLMEKLEEALDINETEQVKEAIKEFQFPGVGRSEPIDFLMTPEAIAEILEENTRPPLVQYAGDLGRFFGQDLSRTSFFAYIAPEKRGKTWFLIDMAVNALRSGNRVLFVTVGDMSPKQIQNRILQRIAGLPIRPTTLRYPKRIIFEGNDPTVDFETRSYEDTYSMQTIFQKSQKFRKRYLENRISPLKIIDGQAGVFNFDDLTAAVNHLVNRDWIPDVIIIDYADVMAVDGNANEFRHGTNKLWALLRGLSQSLDCLVVTATQADASSYGTTYLTRKNFTDDKRKLAHVTGMVGLNQTHEEKRQGIYRLNWVVRRNEEFDEYRPVYVAGHLKLGRPVILSSFRRQDEQVGEKGGDC